MIDWQPIETAPKDGRSVLVWWEHWALRPIVAYYHYQDGWLASEKLGSEGGGPTHWMPLPDPPGDGE